MEYLLVTSKESGPEVNAVHVHVSQQNRGQYQDINFSNKNFKHGIFQIFGNNSSKSTQHS
jgi:hypothetical protein